MGQAGEEGAQAGAAPDRPGVRVEPSLGPGEGQEGVGGGGVTGPEVHTAGVHWSLLLTNTDVGLQKGKGRSFPGAEVSAG